MKVTRRMMNHVVNSSRIRFLHTNDTQECVQQAAGKVSLQKVRFLQKSPWHTELDKDEYDREQRNVYSQHCLQKAKLL